MHRPGGGLPVSQQDIYEFSLEDEDPKIFLSSKVMERASPLGEYIRAEHHQGGLFSLEAPSSQGPLGPGATPKKKRKRCGVCGPCLRKENCGSCTSCFNRKVGHQICKLRKCDELKKKMSAWETVSGVGSVDGPRRRGQMESGSHERLEEGLLSLGLTNGASRRSEDEEDEVTGLGTGVAGEGHKRAGCELLEQIWGSGQDKTDHFQLQQQQQPCWNSVESVGTANDADIENARNLVALSAAMGTRSPCTHAEQQVHTAQLYEKFKREMGEGAQAEVTGKVSDGEQGPPEDLNTLQTALSQARHGHKPPNCNCEGPDCPDYLEWLEKKIKLMVDDQDKKQFDAPNAPHSGMQENPSHPSQQLNGAILPDTSTAANAQQRTLSVPLPSPMPCSLPPIPCSPSVLSIAKEKNISLQTAIAIEALTQLSATLPQPVVPPADVSSKNHPHHQALHCLPSHSQHGSHLVLSSSGSLSSSCSSPMLQTIASGLHAQQEQFSWEQHRRQSQVEDSKSQNLPSSSHSQSHRSSRPPCAVTPLPTPASTSGSDLLLQWQQGTKNPWMMLNSESQPCFAASSHSSGDPMSELKQLLGDSSGKYMNAAFKSPVSQQDPHHRLKEKGPGLGVPHIKQEVDTGEYPGSACAAMERYGGMVNEQHQIGGRPLSPGSATIRHSTQASLQQYLHHKRNLFSSSPSLHHRPAFHSLQDLRKWWPQMGPSDGCLQIKQELKEPKKKKSTQASPSVKQPLIAGLHPQLGLSLPKPKQIVIKKPKQKASQPTFMPQAQISFQKPPPNRQENVPFLASANMVPAMLAMEKGPYPALTPAHSQESSLNRATPTPTQHKISESSHTAPNHVPSSVPLPQNDQDGSGPEASQDGSSAPSTASQTPVPQTAPPLGHLSTLNPKLEELIRQFEAEFGDPSPMASVPSSQTQTSELAPAQPSSNSGQAVPPASSSDELPAQPTCAAGDPPAATGDSTPAAKVMDVDVEPNRSASTETKAPQAPAESEMEQQRDGVTPGEGCPSSQAQESLLQLQQQQHRVLEDPFTVPFSPLPKRMKIESSGGVTVLSTTACFSTASDETPTKLGHPSAPSLRGFLESPLRYLDTPTKSLLDTPAKNVQPEFPLCDCVEQIVEKDEGPYYNHLGSGPTVASIRELMENRFGEKGDAIRIEKVVYTGKEGKSSQGCPIAKWVIRRGSEKEKLLCLVRERAGHHCDNAVIIVVILAWEGVPRALGDKLYRELSDVLTKFGNPTSRRCGFNEDRTCACQGKDPNTCGASFSFGCSWSMYFNGCKYARSKLPRKFRLQGDHPKEEEHLRDNFQDLATRVAPLYKKLAPKAYSNQCALEETASDCRLGLKEGRPFSGVTACMDFCAHAHKDQHNLHNGCTVVCTLTKEDNRMIGQIPDDEQLHVLPLYKVSPTDEFGSEENQRRKMQNGSIQVLSSFRREVRKLPEPAKSCRQRRLEAKKAASEKKKAQKQQLGETPEKIIKTEVLHTGPAHPQQGNKAIPKQEVKPTIKTETKGRFQAINGVLEGYPSLGNHQATKPYSMNSVYPHSRYYASGHSSNGLPPSPAPSPVNGFHSNPALHYGYYSYPSNALFPPQLLGYEGRNGTWPKAAAVATSTDKKPDVQSLQASLAHSYPGHLEEQPSDATRCGYHSEFAKALPPPGRPLSAPSELRHRVTPVIKQEPIDRPHYSNCAAEGSSRRCSSSYSPAPQSDAWPGHVPNGTLVAQAWNGAKEVSQESFTPEKQQLHQQHQHQPIQRQQPQQLQQQWSYPGASTPLGTPSPSPSPALKTAPSPSPSPHHLKPQGLESPSPGLQPKHWGMAVAGYGMGLKQHGTAGAFPDKLWSKAGESRGSTPLGLQEKAWKSCGGSVAGSTPSPAPEGRLFPDAFQQADMQACCETAGAESEVEAMSEREQEEDEVWSDSEHNFLDPNIGGVAVAPAHGSILIECARRELHATTPLKKPDRGHPTRISLVFYQHKNLNQPCHGLALWEAKMKVLAERALQRQQEAALLGLSQEDIKAYGKKRKWGVAGGGSSSGPTQGKDGREGVITRQAPTQHSTSVATVSPYAFTQLTGPYSRWV